MQDLPAGKPEVSDDAPLPGTNLDYSEDLSEYRFQKFAATYFQSNATHQYSRKPLKSSLLLLQTQGDQLVMFRIESQTSQWLIEFVNTFQGGARFVGDDTALHGRHAGAQVSLDGPRQHFSDVTRFGHPRAQFHPHQRLPRGADNEHGIGTSRIVPSSPGQLTAALKLFHAGRLFEEHGQTALDPQQARLAHAQAQKQTG